MLLAACGGEAATLEEICEAFRLRLPEDLKAIREAVRDRDGLRLREAAHKLAGMVATFSSVAGGLALELEDRAAQGQLEEAQPLAERLEAMAEHDASMDTDSSSQKQLQMTWDTCKKSGKTHSHKSRQPTVNS